MKVVAAPGLSVPKEERPREYINGAEAVEVPESAYYLRCLADGDLVSADAAATKAAKTAPAEPKE